MANRPYAAAPTSPMRFAAPVARILLASIFLISGVGKVGGYAATGGYMESQGVPSILLPAVIALEIGGSLAIIMGAYARVAALLLAGFSLVSAAIFHAEFSDQVQQVLFLKNISIAGGLLLLAMHGPGYLSLKPNR